LSRTGWLGLRGRGEWGMISKRKRIYAGEIFDLTYNAGPGLMEGSGRGGRICWKEFYTGGILIGFFGGVEARGVEGFKGGIPCHSCGTGGIRGLAAGGKKGGGKNR